MLVSPFGETGPYASDTGETSVEDDGWQTDPMDPREHLDA